MARYLIIAISMRVDIVAAMRCRAETVDSSSALLLRDVADRLSGGC